MKKLKIGIIGFGNMGSAIACGMAGSNSVFVYETNKGRAETASSLSRIKVVTDNKELAKSVDILILAVKPKDIAAVLRDIKNELSRRTLVISIAAGITTKFIETRLRRGVPVIRVMPNMPALAGAGISAFCRGRFASKKELAAAKELFKNIGEVVTVRESSMNAVTAVSGSGPAYFFYLVEVLAKAGVELGLDKKTAKKLAVETAFGSGIILKETGEAAEALRAKVTSKGGTTEAAFKEFFRNNLEGVLKKGIRKAFERAKCL